MQTKQGNSRCNRRGQPLTMMDFRMHLVKDIKAMRMDIAHLRVLAASNTDERVLAEIERMIRELDRRIRRDGNRFDQPLDSRGEALNAPA
jgi:hypothetical protein